MRAEDYLKFEYADCGVLFIKDILQEYIDIVLEDVDTEYIVTSKIFYNYINGLKERHSTLYFYNPSYFRNIKLELTGVKLIVNEDDPADLILRKIEEVKPREILFLQREICANYSHSELTECEFLCNIYGIKFTRTSKLLEYLLYEKGGNKTVRG